MNQQFDRVIKDQHGNDLYGYRMVEGQEEIVHIPTGRSNMSYHEPSAVLNPSGCPHVFSVEDMGKRVFTCNRCNWSITANVNQIHESKGGVTIMLKQGEFEVGK
jgi:hypothetical protein